jgi:MFS family permease
MSDPLVDDGQPTVPRRALALGLVVAAQFVLQLDFSIVNIALPTIRRELGFAPADLQWIVTGLTAQSNLRQRWILRGSHVDRLTPARSAPGGPAGPAMPAAGAQLDRDH